MPAAAGFWLSVLAMGLAASCFGIAIAHRSNRRLRNDLETLASHLNALAVEESPPTQRVEFAEGNQLLESLRRLADRIRQMREEQLEALEAGRAARDLKSHLFTGMSHDLRNPLNSIIGFTDLLLKGIEGPLRSEQLSAVRRIGEESERLIILVGDILDTSKLDVGRFELEREWNIFVEILNEAAEEAGRLVGSRGIAIETSLRPGLPPLFVDRTRIKQALVSLVARVIDEIEEGKIVIGADLGSREGDPRQQLKIRVVDALRAVGPEARAQIREAAESRDASAARSRSGGGGLGIALARDTVRLHGGELVVDPAEGASVLFTVWLPLDDEAQ